MPKTDPLTRAWLHIHIIDNDLFIFTDDGEWGKQPDCGCDPENNGGHWKNTEICEMRRAWEEGIVTTFEALDEQCFVGTLTLGEDFNVRIPLNPKVLHGKFGMPYTDLT